MEYIYCNYSYTAFDTFVKYLDSVETWHILLAQRVTNYMPAVASDFCRKMNKLEVSTSYNYGLVEGDDIAFHATCIFDNSHFYEVGECKQHILTYKRLYRLNNVTFSCFDPANLMDLGSVISENVIVSFRAGLYKSMLQNRVSSFIDLAKSLHPRKLRILVPTENFNAIYKRDHKEDILCGCIIWLRLKCIGISVELVGRHEWQVPTLDVLYDQLKTLNASVYAKFMG